MRGGAEVGVSLPRLLLGDQLILKWSNIVDHFNSNIYYASLYDFIIHNFKLRIYVLVDI